MVNTVASIVKKVFFRRVDVAIISRKPNYYIYRAEKESFLNKTTNSMIFTFLESFYEKDT